MNEPILESFKEKFEDSSEYTTKIAESLLLILLPLDLLIARFDIQDLRKVLSKMQSHTSTLEALPFPETMRQGNINHVKDETFEKIIDLAETRQDQLKTQQQESDSSLSEKKMLKELGVV